MNVDGGYVIKRFTYGSTHVCVEQKKLKKKNINRNRVNLLILFLNGFIRLAHSQAAHLHKAQKPSAVIHILPAGLENIVNVPVIRFTFIFVFL